MASVYERLVKWRHIGSLDYKSAVKRSLVSLRNYDYRAQIARSSSYAQPAAQLGRRWPRMLLSIFFVIVLLSLSQTRRQSTRPPAPSSRASILNAVRDAPDAFRNYVKSENCSFTSLDLHQPFRPKCNDRSSLLEAMSNGGRIGFDQPYMPLGCDMQWFSTAETCSILARFDNIYLAGDSQVRYLTQAFNVLLREDLVNGSLATWRFDLEDNPGCDCQTRFYKHDCLWWSATNTMQILDGDPRSIKCSKNERPAKVQYIPMLNFPLQQDMLDGLAKHFAQSEFQGGRDVLVLGHGLWNQLDVERTMAWIEQVEDALESTNADLFRRDSGSGLFPRLFVTPTAQGASMLGRYLCLQNNIRMQVHAQRIRPWVQQRGYDYLGMYNLTAQSSSVDGVHAGFRVNMVKAMMVLNWLNTLTPFPAAVPIDPIPSAPIDEFKPNSAYATLQRRLAAEARRSRTMSLTSASSTPTTTSSRVKPALPTAPHPIDSLVAQAQAKHKTMLDRQSSTIEIAAKEYRKRRGRHPPPDFDKWVLFAQQKGSVLVEGFFDTIYDSINPLWGVPALELREFSSAWFHIVSIRKGKTTQLSPVPVISDPVGTWQQSLDRLPDLPDVDLPFNPYDEPIIFAPWTVRQEGLKRANASRTSDLRGTKNIIKKFPTYPALADQKKTITLEEFDDDMVLWTLASQACPPSSAARNLSYDADFTKPTNFTSSDGVHFIEDGVVADWAGSKSPCQDPTIASSHGSFVGPKRWRPISTSVSDSWTLITKLVVMLGSCRIHDITQEIPIPCGVCLQAAGDDARASAYSNAKNETSWEEKQDKLFWRGAASDGMHDADNWTRFQRHRLVAMLNATMVSTHMAAFGQELPAHLPGGEPELPHNFAMPFIPVSASSEILASGQPTTSAEQTTAPLGHAEKTLEKRIMTSDQTTKTSSTTIKHSSQSTVTSDRTVKLSNQEAVSLSETSTRPSQTRQRDATQTSLPRSQSLSAMQGPKFFIDFPAWINRHTNVSFTDLRCWTSIGLTRNASMPCPYTSPYYTTAKAVNASTTFDYKYLPDVDGASYSGRFWGFLNSGSVPLKSTIYDEWSDGRLTPWRDFVPLTVGLSDLWDVMQWLVGFDPSDFSVEELGLEAWIWASTYMSSSRRQAEAVTKQELQKDKNATSSANGTVTDNRAIAGHDAAAAKIARQGSEWAKRVLRRDDMDVYLYRVVLEVARVCADDRELMGFVDDLNKPQ